MVYNICKFFSLIKCDKGTLLSGISSYFLFKHRFGLFIWGKADMRREYLLPWALLKSVFRFTELNYSNTFHWSFLTFASWRHEFPVPYHGHFLSRVAFQHYVMLNCSYNLIHVTILFDTAVRYVVRYFFMFFFHFSISPKSVFC